MPPNTVYVGRPTVWGNPFGVIRKKMSIHFRIAGEKDTPEEAVEAFRCYAIDRLEKEQNWLAPLRGKNLACWCNFGMSDVACHADVLLELANRKEI